MRTRNLLPLFFLVIFSCTGRTTDVQFPPAQAGIVPASTPEIPLVGTDVETEALDTPGIVNQPRVSIPPSLISHQTIDVNLDGDEVDEQIVIVKQREDPEDLIRILVVDYDQVRSSYFLSWTGQTRSTNLRALTVYTDDVTGNQLPEVLVFGVNGRGEQTLDIFQWNTGSTIYGIQYRPILSVLGDTGIEILENGQNPVFGKTVVVVNRNLSSDNPLDTTRSTYAWRSAENRFVLSSTSEVSGASLAQSQLADLYGASEEVFLNFLRGPWYKDEGAASLSDVESLRIISFDPERGNLTFYRPGRMLSFFWIATTKVVYGGRVRIDLRNEVIPSVQTFGTVNLTSLDSLILSMTGAESWVSLPTDWNGTYRRLPPTSRDTLSAARNQRLQVSPIHLSGLFRAADGSELFFSNPNLVLRTQGTESSGGYAIFQFSDLMVLQILFLNPNGTVSRSVSFKLDYEEDQDGETLKRIIVLEPIALQASGIAPQGGGRLRFEQILEAE